MKFFSLKRTETPKEQASRSEVFSKIAEAKRNEYNSVHIDAPISLDLFNELSLMGYDAYYVSGHLATDIYWKNF